MAPRDGGSSFTIMKIIMRSMALLVMASCASAPANGGDRITVLVYNIHAGKDAKGVDNLERVAGIVRRSNADFVLLQEVDRGTRRSGKVDQLSRLRELTGMHGSFGRTLDYQDGQYGIAILSRWPIATDTLILLPPNPSEQRGALVAISRTPKGLFRLVNTHLDASRADSFRIREAKVVAAIANETPRLGVASVPDVWRTLFVGGDFNSEPGSQAHATMISAGWRDAFDGCGKGSGLSFPVENPVKRIDYLFIPNGVSCSDARVLDTKASDHRPVLFHLSVRAWRKFAAGNFENMNSRAN